MSFLDFRTFDRRVDLQWVLRSLFACLLWWQAPTCQNFSELEAYAIGVEDHPNLYPLIIIGFTRKRIANFERGSEFGHVPTNTFVGIPDHPPASSRGVAQRDAGTMDFVARLDFTKAPLVVSVPGDEGGGLAESGGGMTP